MLKKTLRTLIFGGENVATTQLSSLDRCLSCPIAEVPSSTCQPSKPETQGTGPSFQKKVAVNQGLLVRNP